MNTYPSRLTSKIPSNQLVSPTYQTTPPSILPITQLGNSFFSSFAAPSKPPKSSTKLGLGTSRASTCLEYVIPPNLAIGRRT